MDGPISTDMIHTSSKQSWEQNLNNNKIFFLVYFATNRELFSTDKYVDTSMLICYLKKYKHNAN